ncbi:uncharacterized protein LOC5520327 [Nematostella vectensis]|uniref:uncharacterized protein LOC5520327 n=1 Tax=Nematostella vectensis TaxID=45351 RepID=UPI0020777CE0|nr:uncharacterized protein LOC5520327 [Nematostella vectensis]
MFPFGFLHSNPPAWLNISGRAPRCFCEEKRTSKELILALALLVTMLTVSLVGKKFSCSIQLQILSEKEGGGFELALNAGEKCSERSQAVSQVSASLNVTIQSGCKNRVTRCQEMLMFLQEQAIPKTMNVMKVHMVSGETKQLQRDGMKLFNCIRTSRRERERIKDRSTSQERLLSSRGYASDSERYSKFSSRSRSTDSFISSRCNVSDADTSRHVKTKLPKAGIFRERKMRAASLERLGSSISSLDLPARRKELEVESDREVQSKSSHHARCLESSDFEKKFEKHRKGRVSTKKSPRKNVEKVTKEHSKKLLQEEMTVKASTSAVCGKTNVNRGLTLELKRQDTFKNGNSGDSETKHGSKAYFKSRSLMEIPSLCPKNVDRVSDRKYESSTEKSSLPVEERRASTLPSRSGTPRLTKIDVVDDNAALRAFARRITRAIINSAVTLLVDRVVIDLPSTGSNDSEQLLNDEVVTATNDKTLEGKPSSLIAIETSIKEANCRSCCIYSSRSIANSGQTTSVATQTEAARESKDCNLGHPARPVAPGRDAVATKPVHLSVQNFKDLKMWQNGEKLPEMVTDLRDAAIKQSIILPWKDKSSLPHFWSSESALSLQVDNNHPENSSPSLQLYDVYQDVKDKLKRSLASRDIPNYSIVLSESKKYLHTRRYSWGCPENLNAVDQYPWSSEESGDGEHCSPRREGVSCKTGLVSRSSEQVSIGNFFDRHEETDPGDVKPERAARHIHNKNCPQEDKSSLLDGSHSWYVHLPKKDDPAGSVLSSLKRSATFHGRDDIKKATQGVSGRHRYMRSISEQNERRRWKAAQAISQEVCEIVHGRASSRAVNNRDARCVSCPVLSEEDVVLEGLFSHHRDVCERLSHRTRVVVRVQELWCRGEAIGALTACLVLTGRTAGVDVLSSDGFASLNTTSATKDNALFLNIIQQLPTRSSSWTWGMCHILLPHLKDFISTRMHSSHVCMACNILHLIVQKVSGFLLRRHTTSREPPEVISNCLSELTDIETRTDEVLVVLHNKALTKCTEDTLILRSVLSELLLAIRTLRRLQGPDTGRNTTSQKCTEGRLILPS